MAAPEPWYSLATGVGQWGGIQSPRNNHCFWPSHLQLWSFHSVPSLHISGQAALMGIFVKSSFLSQPFSSERGKGHSQMGSASQLWIRQWRSTDLLQLVPRTAPFWLFHYSVPPWNPQDPRGPFSSNLSTTTVTQLKVPYRQNIPHVTLQAAWGVKRRQEVTARKKITAITNIFP